MKKTYIEAQYRIKNQVYNNGYLCINKDSIIGIFSLDCACIEIKNEHIHFYLKEFKPEDILYHETKEFISIDTVSFLESPCSYILKSNSNVFLSLELIKRVTDISSISSIVQTFESIFGK